MHSSLHLVLHRRPKTVLNT
ncbi:hypothetical protein F383_13238 [Gossypium arboreum]|uniref:Uncharacterized protein n=1 Tax=Gossypium arboreum TaxID=29729 RepID=A0A0B0PY15_GOSAR|nr:hypothetical protein F383_13238 [Gossypium arboreum]